MILYFYNNFKDGVYLNWKARLVLIVIANCNFQKQKHQSTSPTLYIKRKTK